MYNKKLICFLILNCIFYNQNLLATETPKSLESNCYLQNIHFDSSLWGDGANKISQVLIQQIRFDNNKENIIDTKIDPAKIHSFCPAAGTQKVTISFFTDKKNISDITKAYDTLYKESIPLPPDTLHWAFDIIVKQPAKDHFSFGVHTYAIFKNAY